MQDFLNKLSTKQKIIIISVGLIIALITFILLYKYFYSEEEQIITNESSVQNEINELEEQEQSSPLLGNNKNRVTVHVIGEVNSPGVVTLNEGQRIIDAINSAGGKTEEADLSRINLAYLLEDGVQIYVPRIGENKEEFITESPGEGIITESATMEESEKKDIKVNINTATQEKLMTLPGIGESTAQKIIDYRTQNGKFQTPEDLKNVPGIGEAKYNNLSGMITTK